MATDPTRAPLPIGSIIEAPQPPAAPQPKPAPKKRASNACRRCRRMRSKCVHEPRQPPCEACAAAGLGPDQCIFTERGSTEEDREFRHPRQRADKNTRRDATKLRREILDLPVTPRPTVTMSSQITGVDPWDLLPPVSEIIEGVQKFTQNYFQLGFIHKESFIERLRTQPRSIPVFLLLGILSISARMTPSIVRQQQGNAQETAELYIKRASRVALNELYQQITIERCQGFYLLGIAQQGSAQNHESIVNLGIARSMATIMELHQEDSYRLPPTADPSMIITAESARRTMWMLHSQDNLHSGPRSLSSLDVSYITTLLPSTEEDFAAGRVPKTRAALEDTPPAVQDPSLVNLPDRSLFATLIQTHYFWGRIIRRAMRYDRSNRPWEPESQYAQISSKLTQWELDLPAEQVWHAHLLNKFRSMSLDLAFLAVTNVTRLCNIVLRKAYIAEMINPDAVDPPAPPGFWENMARELFENVSSLYTEIDAQFIGSMPQDDHGAQMALFCVYSCGHMAVYLRNYPYLIQNPKVVGQATTILNRASQILEDASRLWKIAERWKQSLHAFASDLSANPYTKQGTMADGADQAPDVISPTASKHPSSAASIRPDERNDTVMNDGAATASAMAAAEPADVSDLHIDPNMRATANTADMQPTSQQQAIAALQASHQAAEFQQQEEQQQQHQQQYAPAGQEGHLEVLSHAAATHHPNAVQTYAGYAQHMPQQGYNTIHGLGHDNYENQLQYMESPPIPQSWGPPGGMSFGMFSQMGQHPMPVQIGPQMGSAMGPPQGTPMHPQMAGQM